MDHVSALWRVALPVAVATTVVRTALNRAVCGAAASARLAPGAKPSTRAVLLEEGWLFVCSNLLLALSTWAAERHNGGCGLRSSAACFDDWPEQHNSPEMAAALAVFLGWYLHGVAKSLVPGIGLPAGADMAGHHVLTLCLIAIGHTFHVQRMGFLILALLNLSSPAMHFAKLLYHGAPRVPRRAASAAFTLFAALFALSRCALFPGLLVSILRTVSDRIARGQREVLVPFIVCFSGLSSLQALQFYWLWRIIRVIARGTVDSSSSKQDSAADVAASGAQPRTPVPDPGYGGVIRTPAAAAAAAAAAVGKGDWRGGSVGDNDAVRQAAPERLAVHSEPGSEDSPRDSKCGDGEPRGGEGHEDRVGTVLLAGGRASHTGVARSRHGQGL